MISVPIRREATRDGHSERWQPCEDSNAQGEHQVTTEAAIGVMPLHTEEHQGSPAATRSQQKGMGQCSEGA